MIQIPSSGFGLIPPIIEAVGVLKPHSILDVGCGNGKYGFLCHEVLHFWKGITPTIDAIEGHPGYIGPVQRDIYNEIYMAEALTTLRAMPSSSYDLILAIEVLEHFQKNDGIDLLRHFRRVSKNVILSCPKRTAPQGAIAGNEYEVHRSQWHLKDFGECVVLPDSDSWIIVMGPDRNKVKIEKAKRSIISNLMRIKSYVRHGEILDS